MMYVKSLALFLSLLSLFNLAGCGDATPQVDFLKSITIEQKIPTKPMTTNLSPTQEISSANAKIKGRVSFVGLQNTISNGDVKIQGKISY